MSVTREEKQLIQAAQGGEQSALVTLYEAHRDSIYTYIYHRVNRNPDVAEDITADVFVRMVSSLHKYKVKKTPLLAWLHTIARNQIIDYYRQMDRNRETHLTDALQDTADLPDRSAIFLYDLDRVHNAMENLTESQRDVLICRYMNDMSVKETAEILNRNEGAIKTLTRRAIGALQRQLRAEVRYA